MRLLASWGSITLALGLTLAACGPGTADDLGDGGTSETGGADPFIPDGPVFCVEPTLNAVTCWVPWLAAAARVMIPCQVQVGISGGAWGSGYDDTLAGWGPVTCHDLLAADGRFCLFSEFGVLLSRTFDVDGSEVWVIDESAAPLGYPAVDPPCGDVVGDGDGDGDPGGDGDGDGDPGGDGDGDPVDNGRLTMVEFMCVGNVCQGRWEGTDLWSMVVDADVVGASVETPDPWDCSPDLDVDICIEVDEQGHVGCFWFQDGWAVAVAPSCAVSGIPWLDVGNDMLATAI